MVPAGGADAGDRRDGDRTDRQQGRGPVEQLYMHGPGVFSFSVDRVPPLGCRNCSTRRA